MRECDVGEREVKRGSYFSVMSQGTEVQQKSPIYQNCIFYDHSILHYVKRR
jgi:hypothetical protein